MAKNKESHLKQKKQAMMKILFQKRIFPIHSYFRLRKMKPLICKKNLVTILFYYRLGTVLKKEAKTL